MNEQERKAMTPMEALSQMESELYHLGLNNDRRLQLAGIVREGLQAARESRAQGVPEGIVELIDKNISSCANWYGKGGWAPVNKIKSAILPLLQSAPQPEQVQLDSRDKLALGEIIRELKYMGHDELAHKASKILGRHIGSVIGASDPQPDLFRESDSDHVFPTGLSQQAADAERTRFAIEDIEDVDNCDWCVSIMEPEARNNSRGGRHVEFGYALGKGKRMIVIGNRETVFHHLPHVEWYQSVEDFICACRGPGRPVKPHRSGRGAEFHHDTGRSVLDSVRQFKPSAPEVE